MRMREHYDQALDVIDADLLALGQMVVKQVERAVEAQRLPAYDTSAQVIADDQQINHACAQLKAQIVGCIATQQPVAGDLRRLVAALDTTAELERIGDYAKSLAKLSIQEAAPAAAAEPLFTHLAPRTVQLLGQALLAFANRDPARARATAALEMAVDADVAALRATLLSGAEEGSALTAGQVNLMFSAYMLERIADRATNIAEAVLFQLSGERAQLNEEPPAFTPQLVPTD